MTLLTGESIIVSPRPSASRPSLTGLTEEGALAGRRPTGRHRLSIYALNEPSAPLPPLLSHAQGQLQSLVDLPAAWDGRRAKPVTQASVEAIVKVLVGAALDQECILPQYFPLPDGGVQIEWHADGQDIEIEADGDGSVHVFAAGPDVGTTQVDDTLTGTVADVTLLSALRKALRQLTERVAAAQ